MNHCFCRFPQNQLWYKLHHHLLNLPGVKVTSFEDMPVGGSWLDFTFLGHFFTINAVEGEYLFFVEDCPDGVCAEVQEHFIAFFSNTPGFGNLGDITKGGV